MIGSREHRRSRQFAQGQFAGGLGTITRESGVATGAGIAPLLRLSLGLRPGLAVAGPTTDYRAALRARLLVVGSTAAAPVLSVAPPWRRRLAAASAVLAISTTGVAATAVASTDALPGDRLYEVKRAVESVRLALAGSDLAKGEQYLSIAETRLSEVRHLLAGNPRAEADPVLVQELRETLSDASSAITTGSELFFAAYRQTVDAAVLVPLERFLAQRAGAFTEVRRLLPAQLVPKQDSLLRELEVIAARVATVTGRPVAALTPEPAPGPARGERAARASRAEASRDGFALDRTMGNVDSAVSAAGQGAQTEAAATAAEQARRHAPAEPDLRVVPSAAAEMLRNLLPLPEGVFDAVIPGSLSAGLRLDTD